MLTTTLLAAAILAATENPGPKPNGPMNRVHRCHALIGGTVVSEPGTRIEDATIIVRNGRIEALGTDVPIPPDARIWPMQGQFIYAGLIEPAATVSVEELPSGVGAHWNEEIRPQLDLGKISGLAAMSDGQRAKWRDAGYTTAAVYPDDGILRGTGTIVTLPEDPMHQRTLDGRPALAAAFDRGGWGSGTGPGSLMGSIALRRQTLHDARWYEAARTTAAANGLEPPARQDDLAALVPVMHGTQHLMVDVRDHKEAMRAGALANECDIELVVLGEGDEFRDLSGIQSLACPVIVQVDYPEAPRLASIDQAIRVPLRTLQSWEQSPTNLRRLRDHGIFTCVTTTGLDNPADVRSALRQAIHAGLTADEALAAVTVHPAELLDIDHQAGRIAPGMLANLVICDGELFDEDTTIDETWVGGWRDDHKREPLVTLKGKGQMHIGSAQAEATIDTSAKKLSVTLDDGTTLKTKKVDITGHRVQASMDGRILDETGWLRISGVIRDDELLGRAVRADGSTMPMRLVVSSEATETEDSDDDGTEDTADAETATEVDPVAGTWNGSIDFGQEFSPPMTMTLTRDGDSISGSMRMMERDMSLSDGAYDANSGTISFAGTRNEFGQFALEISIDGNLMTGTANSRRGEATFTASREGDSDGSSGDSTAQDETAAERWANIPDHIPYPLGARGRHTTVAPEDVRFEHATLWTADEAGIIEDGCLIVQDGRLSYVGPMATAPTSDSIRTVDATGWHITPGLIDCHSHTGIDGGVNEWNGASTAEVGIGDVVSGDDMDWYRQLAGGLTAANQLHGSANPIGGRNRVIKLRWGQPARGFPIEGATKGIKFALGENVKRSSGRYPDTRMGVEAFMRDRLTAARSYDQAWDRWNALNDEEKATRIPPRRDIELDTLAEVLRGERLIHCHSYRQDEILALLRTCEHFDITIGTLQHILEGYKVADDIARHGAGASSFSDWWAYKVEVMDAIPWNGAIMHEQGVLVSFNSDDAELATRMNDEAAKAVRYGNLPPNEALKFVTLNPARQLDIHQRTGSLVAGKDADLAVWNADPLSSYSLCMQTWIDGGKYYDREEDTLLAARDAAERTRLVELVLRDNLGKPPAPTPDEESEPAWAKSPYDRIDDHRGCCGIPANFDELHQHEHDHAHDHAH